MANNFRDLFKNIRYVDKSHIEECFNDILEYIEKCETRVEDADKKLKEWNKDEEIQKLKEQLEAKRHEEANRMVFIISAEEKEAINNWIDKHIEEKHGGNRYAGAIGGQFTYKFIPTSIGEIGEIVCGACGESFCFRELD